MKRIKLEDRALPNYTKKEEQLNTISHIVGGALGVVAVLACAIVAAYHRNIWGIVSGIVYGCTVILLFTMSSIYHGMKPGLAKKVFQVLDHCTIFLLIAGTYTPMLLNRFRDVYPTEAWINFAIIWGLAALGITLNAIDLKRYRVFSMICYLGMGWLIIFSVQKTLEVLGAPFFWLILAGGICYTAGAVLYMLGKQLKKKYMHSVFHFFVDAAALLHFLGIVLYVMPG